MMISTEDYLYFARRALDGMTGIVVELGDDLANTTPDLPGANSPYALLNHCLGVVEAWAGGFVAGRLVERDREAEFRATGAVAPLVERAQRTIEQLTADVATAEPEAPLRAQPPGSFQGPDRELTQGAALQHVYEELAQHHGQMELMRDILRRDHPRSRELAPFDEDRLRSGAGVKWGIVEPDVLPAWVADMDFGVPSAVREVVADALAHEDFGYPWFAEGDPVVRAFERRMADRFGWRPSPDRTRVFTDLLQILQLVIESSTAPGDGVAIHVPAYPPFLASITRAGRRIVPIPMRDTAAGWRFDTTDLAARLSAAGTRLIVLVNPHNPTGRVLTQEELEAVADAASALDAVVLSDEIHADLVYAGARHLPFASISDDTAARTVTATSATKTFNIAGLRCALAHIGPDALWQEWAAAPIDLYGTPSTLGKRATAAVWADGEPWHRELMQRLQANRSIVRDWVDASAYPLRHHSPEATYLAWIDFSGTAIADDAAGALRHLGRVLLSAGPEFVQGVDGDARAYARLNLATSERNLREILRRVDTALEAAARGDGPIAAGAPDPARAYTGGEDNL